ncbi:hypothetical protein [Phenylobacterium sp.]|uniref:hypothetical protein n=1 Tax=Phenylobacterium sp. TaxID=1871053 RepID=UPI001214FD4B|nr:hypothetical protein [Phenylobacterium sp.]THD58256.1 MAG: hypothetical protein E8A49_19940 [Phenylobacterium sp.]
MRRKQLILLLGALLGVLLVAGVVLKAGVLAAHVSLPADDAGDRLAFAVRWLLVPGLTLLAGIQVAARRGFVPEAIDGTRTPANHALEINLRYNQNTLEQVVLAAIAWAGLALSLPHGALALIPAMAGLFAFGCAAFWIGYLIHPLGRAFGMVVTALPTLGAYVWLIWRAFH